MKVLLIKDQLISYSSYLSELDVLDHSYLWHAQDHFLSHWDIEGLDFEGMFDKSFQSTLSQRLWKREHYFPKEMMLTLIQLEKETMRSIFRDLLNENKDLNLRVNRFVHHIDQMLQAVQRKDRKASTHFHSDLRFVFVYLSFCYPETYTLYEECNFLKYLKKVEARKIPRNHDPILFRNMMKATRTIMMKDEKFLKEKNRLSEEHKLTESSDNLWVCDFYTFVATGEGKHKDF